MKLSKLIDGIDYILQSGNTDVEISDVIYDSRKVVKGCAFVCL